MPKVSNSNESFPCNHYLGIDPGKQGGLAVIKDKQVISWNLMPDNDLSLLNLLKEWDNEYQIRHCFLEQVRSMPGEGHKGAFTFGMGYGKLLMALTACQIPFETVDPRVWQKILAIPPRKKNLNTNRKKSARKKRGAKKKQKSQPHETKAQFKDRLCITSQRLFPGLVLWQQPKTLGKQRAVCDAILIAEACRRRQEGLLG